MPQMSPMSWILISTMFFLLMNIFNKTSSSSLSHQLPKNSSLKTLKWKW